MDRFEQAMEANIEEVFGDDEEREEAIRRARLATRDLATATDEKVRIWAAAIHGGMKNLAEVLGTDDPEVDAGNGYRGRRRGRLDARAWKVAPEAFSSILAHALLKDDHQQGGCPQVLLSQPETDHPLQQ